MPKYIFVTGGVVSSLGKGIACASIGKILEAHGLRVSLVKCDPYINVDPGTMNPYQHGEVYVTDDGAETDLDLGHYHRFTNSPLTKDNNITTGKIYYSVITKERRGDFLGGTVQVVPHITNEIKKCIRDVAKAQHPDVVIVEIGGTVGDIEGLPFLEAIRQFKREVGPTNAIDIHVTLIPYIKAAGEIKTKPTQHSVGKLREIGIQPDILLCRTERELGEETKEKIALFCNVNKESVFELVDVKSIYEVPLRLKDQAIQDVIFRALYLSGDGKGDLKGWKKCIVDKIYDPRHRTRIAVVGKYITLQDAYKSIDEALLHGGIANDARVEIVKVDADKMLEEGCEKYLGEMSGILVPGGFGYRGIEGKIRAIEYARRKKVPFLGICLGMQTAVIEFARNVVNLKGAHSTEFDKKTRYPVISLLSEQRKVKGLGGTMRLGIYQCKIKKGTKTFAIYGKEVVGERHRHRYEFNSRFEEMFRRNGMLVVGRSHKENLAEIVELKDHPYFIAVQFHPEFRSKPDKPHPLFLSFVRASLQFQSVLR